LLLYLLLNLSVAELSVAALSLTKFIRFYLCFFIQ